MAIAWPGMGAEMRGIRLRATVLVSAVTAIALVVGGVILVAILRGQLIDNLDSTLSAQAIDRAALLAEGADPESLTASTMSEALVWIGTTDGTTLASGGRRVAETPPVELEPGIRTTSLSFIEDHGDNEPEELENEELRVVIVAANRPDGSPVMVVVGTELEVVTKPVGSVSRALVAGTPFFLALVAVLTWTTANRALRPVESIRQGAEQVGASGHGESVPVPDTGDEIERLARTVNEMLESLDAHGVRQRQFVADASHELKSPLATLRLEAETSTSLDQSERTRSIRQIDRLTAIVDDLLALARSDETHPSNTALVDIDEAVFDAIEMAAPRPGITIDIEHIAPTRLSGDGAQLRRLVRNLIDNARRHATSRVVITLNTDDGRVTLHVDDDGPGVPLENRATIFERFARMDESRARDDGGTGLGLAIARQITERHQGTLTVTEAPIGGARFTATLPFARD